MRSRVSAAFAAGGLPGPLDAFGTSAFCHTAVALITTMHSADLHRGESRLGSSCLPSLDVSPVQFSVGIARVGAAGEAVGRGRFVTIAQRG